MTQSHAKDGRSGTILLFGATGDLSRRMPFVSRELVGAGFAHDDILTVYGKVLAEAGL